MEKLFFGFATFCLFTFSAPAQIDWGKTQKNLEKEVNKYTGKYKKNKKPTDSEVIQGLREALNVGANNSAAQASQTDGFYKNPLIFIPFPPEAEKVKSAAVNLGMQKQVDEFVMTLNRAAEEASKEAAPVFLNAIREMTIQDGWAILKGADDAATAYLKDKTSAELTAKFSPIIKIAIDKVHVTKYWNPIITAYNIIPGVEKLNPDLEQYITAKALKGLFMLIADEEKKIRLDPGARVSAILKKVFGYKA